MQGFVDDLVDESRKRTDVLLDVVRKEIQRQVKTLGIATKEDLARLETKIAKQAEAGARPTKRRRRPSEVEVDREEDRRRRRPRSRRRSRPRSRAKKAASKAAAPSGAGRNPCAAVSMSSSCGAAS